MLGKEVVLKKACIFAYHFNDSTDLNTFLKVQVMQLAFNALSLQLHIDRYMRCASKSDYNQTSELLKF